MPYAVMLYLEPRTGNTDTPGGGYCGHAAFLNLVRGLDPAMAQRLHDDDGRKPFTTWLTRSRTPDAPNGRHALRLTLLDDQLFAPIVGGILTQAGLGLRVGAAEYQVTGMATHPAAHHLAGFATYHDMAADTVAPQRIKVRFTSPTVFRSQSRDILWPDPRLAWQSWLRSWNEHCEETLRFDETRVIEEQAARVRVRMHEVRTRHIALADGGLSGFVGLADYDLANVPPEARRTLAALARYAFFCGTGRKTTMGLGQTRPLNLT